MAIWFCKFCNRAIGQLITYEADADALAELNDAEQKRFAVWMEKIDAEHQKAGSPYGQGSLWQLTGAECWLSSFQDGDDPADALAEDLNSDNG